MSENATAAALRALGYPGDTMTAHGFRSAASTLLHEQGYQSDRQVLLDSCPAAPDNAP